jgi:hypothetical protein
VRVFHADHFQQPAELPSIWPKPVDVYLHASMFYNIDSLLAQRLQESLIGCK